MGDVCLFIFFKPNEEVTILLGCLGQYLKTIYWPTCLTRVQNKVLWFGLCQEIMALGETALALYELPCQPLVYMYNIVHLHMIKLYICILYIKYHYCRIILIILSHMNLLKSVTSYYYILTALIMIINL